MKSTITTLGDVRDEKALADLAEARAVSPFDSLTRTHTSFASFDALLNAEGGYRPSIYMRERDHKGNVERVALALAYDDMQSARGDSRRAFRGNW